MVWSRIRKSRNNKQWISYISNEIYDTGTEILKRTRFFTKIIESFYKSIIPQEIKSPGDHLSSGSVKTRFKAIFKKWPSWIRKCRFSWIFVPGGRLNHEAYNVRTIYKHKSWFMFRKVFFLIPKNTIPYMGTEILLLTKNDHNSTQKAPKSIIPERIKKIGHSPSSDSVKSRLKAIFKKWPSWIRICSFSWIFAPGGRLNHEAYNVQQFTSM